MDSQENITLSEINKAFEDFAIFCETNLSVLKQCRKVGFQIGASSFVIENLRRGNELRRQAVENLLPTDNVKYFQRPESSVRGSTDLLKDFSWAIDLMV